MTAPTVKEYVLAASLFDAPPTPGLYFRSPSGNSALLVNRVRSVHEGAASSVEKHDPSHRREARCRGRPSASSRI